MRLKSVFISQYKNLKNFTLSFDGASFIDVFVGKNGSGKSNLFEALIEIFRHLYEFDNKGEIGFEYTVKYEISGTETEIAWRAGKLSVNGKARKTIGDTSLPDNVLIYYSGHNDTVSGVVQRYEADFSKRIKGANPDESRRFIGIGPEYKQLLLAVLLLQPAENTARQFICQKLGIKSVGSDIQLTLQRPAFAAGALKALSMDGIENFDSRTHYWGADGITRNLLDKLVTCVKGEFNHGNVYSAVNDQYKIPINIELFQQRFAADSVSDTFRQFDNLKTLGMLEGLVIHLTLTSGLDASISHFSDGQFQSVYIYSIVELFKDRNSLILLDEPDAFLHPEWQFDFLRQVFEITDAAAKNSHVLMSTHSASTITCARESVINLFEFDGTAVALTKATKADAIKFLSAGLIAFSESEAKLSINQVLKSTTGPVLFAEGITDEMILETAWSKLYPAKACEFVVQNAFDRIFLRNLFSRDELSVNFPSRMMFALFDFDEAFDDWNGLKKNCDIETDPCKGLVKQLKCKSHFAMLLPVPDVEELKRQVLDSTGKPWGKGRAPRITRGFQ
ncbi:MAG: AAA family ATPase [Zoogloea oleivorans]|jgi:predicted ATPase|uniref:AAA family ATPase n=1 Tax=Zoogloea oleivorans TaxID=1552750 RepID=UPI002A3708B1|nr:AAA family ATPase [Zoogloea oleivorans]MDY0036944.1 AAA family ATPase [Zoogloea oleivorans]